MVLMGLGCNPLTITVVSAISTVAGPERWGAREDDLVPDAQAKVSCCVLRHEDPSVRRCLYRVRCRASPSVAKNRRGLGEVE